MPVRRVLDATRQVLHLDDPPSRLALALAVGVFIGFTPIWGLQTLLALGVAVACGLNRAATVAGAWLNLPWIAPFVYAGAFKIGTLVVPDPDGVRTAWMTALLEHPGQLTLRDLVPLLQEVSLVLLVGTTLLGGIAAGATYVVALNAITRHRRRRVSRDGGRPRAA
jgi:uncharacterized protein (DUF2062 family)